MGTREEESNEEREGLCMYGILVPHCDHLCPG